MALPKDPFILLSFVNTKLRDEFPTLEMFCENTGENQEKIEKMLNEIGYCYDRENNTFN